MGVFIPMGYLVWSESVAELADLVRFPFASFEPKSSNKKPHESRLFIGQKSHGFVGGDFVFRSLYSK